MDISTLALHAVVQLLHVLLERLDGRLIGPQKGLAGGGLVVADAGLLVGDHGRDEIDGGDVLIDGLNAVDRIPCIEYLPDEHAGEQQQGYHRQEQRLREDPVELIKVHGDLKGSSLIRKQAFEPCQ